VKRQLTISTEPIDEQALLRSRELLNGMGAVVYFLGVVRASEDEQLIAGLQYEAFQKMAEHQFHLLFDQMEKRWPIQSVRLVHRTGLVRALEPSLWVEIAAPHRAEAFAACEWLINEMKRVVPIWKTPVKERPLTGSR
jgi:molybdopterin synthase catalytic subunit